MEGIPKNVVDEKDIPEETRKMIEQDKYYFGNIKFQYEHCLECYYSNIEEFSIKTIFLPLSLKDAEDLLKKNEHHWGSDTDEILYNEDIISRIDKAIKGSFESCFVRLSLRSPKDVYFYRRNAKLEKLYSEELEKSEDQSPNSDCKAFSTAYRNCYRVSDGKEAWEMFVKSGRIRNDLTMLLRFPGAFRCNVVIREWVPMLPQNELRGFVCKNKLTALSQYVHPIFFKELKENKNEIAERIKEYFEKFKESVNLPYENYVLDFCIQVPDGDIKIIEINPFFSKTGAGLFKWANDEKVLKGEEDFEFRIIEEIHEKVMDEIMPVCWIKYLHSLRGICTDDSKAKRGEEKSDKKCIIM